MKKKEEEAEDEERKVVWWVGGLGEGVLVCDCDSDRYDA